MTLLRSLQLYRSPLLLLRKLPPCTRSLTGRTLHHAYGYQSSVDLEYDVQAPSIGTDGALIILHGLLYLFNILIFFNDNHFVLYSGSKRNWQSLCKAFHRALPTRPIYALDLRNHGASPHATPHTNESMVADVKRFIKKYELEDVTVLGHSMWISLSLSVFLFSLVLSRLNLKGRKSRNDARTLQPHPPVSTHHIRHCTDEQTPPPRICNIHLSNATYQQLSPRRYPYTRGCGSGVGTIRTCTSVIKPTYVILRTCAGPLHPPISINQPRPPSSLRPYAQRKHEGGTQQTKNRAPPGPHRTLHPGVRRVSVGVSCASGTRRAQARTSNMGWPNVSREGNRKFVYNGRKPPVVQGLFPEREGGGIGCGTLGCVLFLVFLSFFLYGRCSRRQ